MDNKDFAIVRLHIYSILYVYCIVTFRYQSWERIIFVMSVRHLKREAVVFARYLQLNKYVHVPPQYQDGWGGD